MKRFKGKQHKTLFKFTFKFTINIEYLTINKLINLIKIYFVGRVGDTFFN